MVIITRILLAALALIRANFYRTDEPNSADKKRLTSQTLWLSFPEGGDEEAQVALPVIELKSDLSQTKG